MSRMPTRRRRLSSPITVGLGTVTFTGIMVMKTSLVWDVKGQAQSSCRSLEIREPMSLDNDNGQFSACHTRLDPKGCLLCTSATGSRRGL